MGGGRAETKSQRTEEYTGTEAMEKASPSIRSRELMEGKKRNGH